MTRQHDKISAIVKTLLPWFAVNARDLPWRRTTDPYGVWVSEIMLQQTQVKTVIPYWERWMRSLPTVRSLAEAPASQIHKLWEGLGYYTRVRNMQRAAREILERHGGEFPREPAAILELPGIGRYTAGAIASIAFNQPEPILDGNVIRVLTRLFGIEGNPKEKAVNAELWRLSGELVWAASRDGRPWSCSHLNQALMELGALVCAPRQPTCLLCPVREQCVAQRTGRVEQLPNLGPRGAATPRHFVAFVVEREGRYLVRQRPAGVVNAHLWEFPNGEVAARTRLDPAREAKSVLGTKPARVEPLCTIKHTITRYRITLDAFRVELASEKASKLPGEWKTPSELKKLPFPSAHLKILNIFAVPPRKH